MAAPYISELVYALVNIKTGNLCYVIHRTAPEVWYDVITQSLLGTDQNQKTLRALGWRAKRVRVEEIGP